MGDVEALLSYYCREKFYRHIQSVCEDVASKKGWDGKLTLWKCFALGMEGNLNQALRELEDLRGKRDYELAAVNALIYFHQGVKLRDYDALAELESSLNAVTERASDVSLLLAANVCMFLREGTRARGMVDKILQKNPMNVKASVARGWIELLDSSSGKSSGHYFDQALNVDRTGKKDLEALMGKAFFHRSMSQYEESLQLLDQAIVAYSWFVPALVEKAKLLVLLQRWDQALETAERVLQQDPNDIGSLKVTVLYRLTREANSELALSSLQQLCDSVERFEPENTELVVSIAKPVARLAGRSEEILRKTLRLLERAKRKNPERSDLVTEYAYQLLMMNKYETAFTAYEQASQLDESNGDALFGQIYCLVKRGDLEEASQQLEFLSVLQETMGRTSQIAFLEALLQWHHHGALKNSLRLLNETVHLHVKNVQTGAGLVFDVMEQFTRFNPDFMLEIAQEYLQHSGSEPIDSTEGIPQHLQSGIKILEKVIKVVPGLAQAQIALGKARFVKNDMEGALKTINHTLTLNPSCSDAHLVLAQINLHDEDFQGAQNALEMALSHNFEIKSNPIFLIVKARVHLAKGDLDESVAILETAMKLPGVKTIESPSKSRRRSEPDDHRNISINERISIFVDLANVYVALKQMEKAKKIIRSAREHFRGTPEEVRVIVADSEICLKQNNIQGALKLLNAVPVDSPSFHKAHLVKANILLTHRNDKDGFIRCYQDIVENSKASNAQPHMLLGEAYMRVNQADNAIEAFKEALKRNPKDAMLASRIGKVLVSTHDYIRAIDYYKSAIRGSEAGASRQALRYDLAELYFNLHKLNKASKELESALQDIDTQSSESKDPDVVDLVPSVNAFKLLAKVHQGENELDRVTQVLEEARSVQAKILASARSDQQHKMEMAHLCILLALHHENNLNDIEEAVSLYNEALRYDGANVQSMLALAKLHLQAGDLERCHTQCVTIMRVDEQNEQAAMMLADLMFQRNEFKVSIYHYKQLLERSPGNCAALGKLVTLLFRSGELEAAERLFIAAEHQSPRIIHNPGFSFCKGLYYRYSNDINQAVGQFNKARRDVVWGQKALTQMIEIYLNPDNANLWEDHGSSNMESIRTAQQLLEEWPDKQSIDYKVLEAYSLMATKLKSDVEQAFQKLVEIVQDNQNHVPSLLALSTALMMMKQTPKARNQLKRISKMPYNQQDADAFEKCWLVLADIYADTGKYDLAQELCKRCLQYNRSCARAWEYMGMIMEKEASYADAAENYEHAWKLQQNSSASVGYKLAFNYLKAKRYVEAIDVSYKVLKQFPSYPKIRKEILEKAQSLIRA